MVCPNLDIQISFWKGLSIATCIVVFMTLGVGLGGGLGVGLGVGVEVVARAGVRRVPHARARLG